MSDNILSRFLRYVRVETTSRLDRTRSPSTPGQLDLARMLVDELREIGLTDAELDDNGYVFATMPGSGPVVGLLAQLVGASRETVNKALADFASRGWVRLEPRSVVLLDVERLQRRAR